MNLVRSFAPALGVLILATAGFAHAENACGPEVMKTKADWQALALKVPSKPTGMAYGVNGHHHVMSEVYSMRFHLKMAEDLCAKGEDHHALLHLDVVRAYLELPEIAHPTDHHYLFKDGVG